MGRRIYLKVDLIVTSSVDPKLRSNFRWLIVVVATVFKRKISIQNGISSPTRTRLTTAADPHQRLQLEVRLVSRPPDQRGRRSAGTNTVKPFLDLTVTTGFVIGYACLALN